MTVTASRARPAPTGGRENPDARALFEEARRRRRRRRAWTVGAAVLALACVVISVGISRGTPTPPPNANHVNGSAPATAEGASPDRGGGIAEASYTSAYAIGRADASVGWMANGYGVYVTTDAGRTWRTITPPILGKGKPAGEEVGSMVAVGDDDLWLPVEDVLGLVPFAHSQDGSDRGAGIEHSTDGGATWTFTALPGCLQTCGGDISLSFVDAEQGFADQSIADGATELFATTDGGTTWTPVADLPFAGSGAGATLTFTSKTTGWAISGPTFGTYAENGGRMTDPGGRLYHTADGGRSWTLASGLPQSGRYQLPTFFGRRGGVVVGQADRGSDTSPAVYVTSDGGATWTPRPLPISVAAGYARSSPPRLPFAAVDENDWVVDVGPAVYATSDGGQEWSRLASRPATADGAVSAIVFSTRRDGMAIGLPPGCAADSEATGSKPNQCYEVLTGTTDGGRHWAPLAP